MYHKTKKGKYILLKDLKTSHLKNILKWIKKKSKQGITLKYGGGFSTEDMWYEQESSTGKKVKKYYGYKNYKRELKRR